MMKASISTWMRGSAALAFVGLAVAAMPAGARANTVVNSNPAYACAAGTCTQTFDTGSNTLDWSSAHSTLQGFNLNLFDPTLGTLTGVSFAVTFTSTITSGSLTNNGSTPQTFTFKQDTTLGLTTNGVNTALDAALAHLSIDPAYSVTTTLAASPGPGNVFTIPANTAVTGSGTLTTPVSAFLGTGTQQIDASTITFDGFTGGGGNIVTAITTVGDATLAVTYNYSPPAVPEPASVLVFGTALLGLGLIRSKRA